MFIRMSTQSNSFRALLLRMRKNLETLNEHVNSVTTRTRHELLTAEAAGRLL
jgi:hypothetical protein